MEHFLVISPWGLKNKICLKNKHIKFENHSKRVLENGAGVHFTVLGSGSYATGMVL